VIELNDGSLLFATTEFSGTSSDFAPARIIARTSQDGGRTWGPVRELQKDVGKLNVLGTTLRRLPSKTIPAPIAMTYSVTDSYSNLNLFLRISHDEAKTFGEPILVTNTPGYHSVNNDRLTVLPSGRLLVPDAWTSDFRKENHFVCFCFISDDAGKTWRRGKGLVDLPKRGAMEPDVVELNDGRLLMIMRNQLGTISTSFSADGGETWSKPGRLGNLKSPESPATIRRIPATGDLLLVWNNNYEPGKGHGGQRNPLTAAISSDDGQTWKNVRNLESNLTRSYAYTSLMFTRGRAVMSYWDANAGMTVLSSRFRSVPVRWFYEHLSNSAAEQ
jgi:sialidase-1